jgi:hypothetical protein
VRSRASIWVDHTVGTAPAVWLRPAAKAPRAGADIRFVFCLTPVEVVNRPVSPAKTGYVDSRSRRSSGDVAGDESPYDMLRACSSSCAMTASSREIGVEN